MHCTTRMCQRNSCKSGAWLTSIDRHTWPFSSWRSRQRSAWPSSIIWCQMCCLRRGSWHVQESLVLCSTASVPWGLQTSAGSCVYACLSISLSALCVADILPPERIAHVRASSVLCSEDNHRRILQMIVFLRACLCQFQWMKNRKLPRYRFSGWVFCLRGLALGLENAKLNRNCTVERKLRYEIKIR